MALPGNPVTDESFEDPSTEVDETVDTDDGSVEDPSQEIEDDGVDPVDPDPSDPPVSDDPFEEFGGRDKVAQAAQLAQRLSDQDGALEVFFQLGQAFGLDVGQVEALFGRGSGQPEEPQNTPADDDIVTWAQARELMEKELQPFKQQQQQQAEAQARGAVESTLKELGVEDDQTKAAILQLGDRYLRGDLSPKAVQEAVRRGHADFTNLVKQHADQYRQQKSSQAKRVPKTPKGAGAPTSQPEPEPKSVKEAILRARRKLLDQG